MGPEKLQSLFTLYFIILCHMVILTFIFECVSAKWWHYWRVWDKKNSIFVLKRLDPRAKTIKLTKKSSKGQWKVEQFLHPPPNISTPLSRLK